MWMTVGNAYPLQPGTVFWHVAGRDHRILRCDPHAWEEWSVRLEGPWDGPLATLGLLDPGQPVLPGALAPRRLAYDRLWRALDRDAALPLAGLIAYLEQLRAGVDADLMSQAAADLAADVTGALDPTELARDVGLSPAQFRRRFRAAFGCAPLTWRDRHRLAHAGDLLAAAGRSVTEVARRLGYSSPFAFSRRFRQVMGAPPSEWSDQR